MSDREHLCVMVCERCFTQFDESHVRVYAILISLKADGPCSHGVAMLLLLEKWKLAGYKEVPTLLTCTSLPQQWEKPRGEKIIPEPVATMIIAKPSNDNRKRKPIMATFKDNRKIQVTRSDIESLKSVAGSPISYLVEQQDSCFKSTQYGQVPVGAAMAYHAPLIVPLHKPREDHGCGDISFPYTVNLSNTTLQTLAAYEHEWSHLSICQENAQKLERSTTAHSLSKVWIDERSKRITASTFGQITTRKKDINYSFLCNTFLKGQFHSKATSYGTVNENKAKMMYIKTAGVHLHEVGLMVNPQFPFIGATSDAIVCNGGESYIIEVKCPYSARDLTIPEAIQSIRDFFLVQTGDEIHLKQNHKHYFQVQGQLLVSGANKCHFITYTRKDFNIQVILLTRKL